MRAKRRGSLMQLSNLTHDGKPQATPVHTGPFDPIKPLKHLARIFLAQTNAIVFDLDQGKITLRQNPCSDPPTILRVAQSVVEQVIEHFAQQEGIPENADHPFSFVAQIDLSRHGAGHPETHGIAQHRLQIDGNERLFDMFAGLSPGQGE